MHYVIGTLILFTTLAAVTVWHGFALSVLWGWFAVPVLHVMPISALEAAGLALLLRSATMTSRKNGENKVEDWTAWGGALAFNGFMLPLIALAIGWLIKVSI